MSPLTQYIYQRIGVRFARFQRAHSQLELGEQIRTWLATLPPPMGRQARIALRHAYGPQVRWDQVPPPRVRRDRAKLFRTLFSEAARELMRDVVPSAREWAAVELLWTLRRFEVARARWRDVDLTAGVIYVVRKGGKSGWALLTDSAKAAIVEWFEASGQPPDDTPIFPRGRSGQPVTPPTIGKWVRTILQRAGLYESGRGCHAFRRTCATEYLKANPGDLPGLQELLGHEQITTTALYAYLQPSDLRPRLDRVRL